MTQERTFSDSQSRLERLARHNPDQMQETSLVGSSGANSLAFAAKITGLASCNIYNIAMVELNGPGSEPTQIGSRLQAVNLAEPFTADGQLQSGTYVAVLKTGQKNIFYAQV